jgi:serine/threonine-protein kinase
VRPWFALPDGSGIVFSGRTSQTAEFSFYRVALAGDRTPEVLAIHYGPVASISPDGRLLAYSSEETGNFEVYVEPYPNPSLEKWQITQGGGRDPVFSRDGTELYLQNDTTVFAVAIATDPAFSAGPLVPLFDGPYIDSTGRWYDVAPDGRFLMIKPGWLDGAQDVPLNVVLNWFDELERAFALEQ